jgi:hypothetical protein
MGEMAPGAGSLSALSAEPGFTMEQVLQSLRVSAEATAIYLLMSAEPDIDPAELSARSGLAGPDLDAAIAQLADLGLVEPADTGQAGSVGRAAFHLADPELAFAAWLRKREAELGRQRQELADAKAAIAVAATAYQTSAGYSAYSARLLLSQQEAVDRAHQLMANAVDKCLIALPNPLRTLGQAGALLTELAAAGARVAIICGDVARSASGRASLDDLEQGGVQIRTLPLVTVPLLVGDHPPTALLWPGVTDTSEPAVLARGAGPRSCLRQGGRRDLRESLGSGHAA